ncbi:hypothetical protein GW17_00009400 [Ensete ventricosum]|nr:hypothetical protein GW17_00009400 [Ensete ventricosum]
MKRVPISLCHPRRRAVATRGRFFSCTRRRNVSSRGEKGRGDLVEILPSSLVLFILRKLPPKRRITEYHPIQ